MVPDFFADYETVCERIASIDPQAYARTRNLLHGAVSYLSPFITHGIINTRQVAVSVLASSDVPQAEKLLSELGWREFFHRVWQAQGDAIFSDIRQPQAPVSSAHPPAALIEGRCGVAAVDRAVNQLMESGYMHNHARLWSASIACNIGRSHWHDAARWMYYHLLDGDLASNSLSWQWVAGTFSQRKYIANQENINRFSDGDQSGTFLDMDYPALAQTALPGILEERAELQLENAFPTATAVPVTEANGPVLLYSIWNLDPLWRHVEPATRILLIEPGMHREFALSPKRWRFITHWASAIDDLQIFVGSVDELFPQGASHLSVVTREYPATQHWPGVRDPREWCYALPQRPLKSFSSWWKAVRAESPWFQR